MSKQPSTGEWLAHTKGLLAAAEDIFATAELGGPRASDIGVLGITLLARTYSNVKGILLLVEARRVLEARILARCCFENAFFVAGLVKDGEKFRSAMLHDEIKNRTKRGQFILEQQLKLEAETEKKMRKWLKANRHLANFDTLNLKKVAQAGDLAQAYIFYAQLSSDAGHPSVDALSRYVTDADEIDVEPRIAEEELVDTLRLTSAATIGVLVGVNQLLGGTNGGVKLDKIADDYNTLLARTSPVRRA